MEHELTNYKVKGVRALETEYRDVLFRSRTEARWAVFFDNLGVDWEYEPEGYELSSKERYLPDFKINLPSWDVVHVEVKPPSQDARAVHLELGVFAKAFAFAEESGEGMLLLSGPPDEKYRFWYTALWTDEEQFRRQSFYWGDSVGWSKYTSAITASRSYRFWNPNRAKHPDLLNAPSFTQRPTPRAVLKAELVILASVVRRPELGADLIRTGVVQEFVVPALRVAAAAICSGLDVKTYIDAIEPDSLRQRLLDAASEMEQAGDHVDAKRLSNLVRKHAQTVAIERKYLNPPQLRVPQLRAPLP